MHATRVMFTALVSGLRIAGETLTIQLQPARESMTKLGVLSLFRLILGTSPCPPVFPASDTEPKQSPFVFSLFLHKTDSTRQVMVPSLSAARYYTEPQTVPRWSEINPSAKKGLAEEIAKKKQSQQQQEGGGKAQRRELQEEEEVPEVERIPDGAEFDKEAEARRQEVD